MDVPLIIYVGDALARRVAAVDFEILSDALGAVLAELPASLLDQKRRVGVVSDE